MKMRRRPWGTAAGSFTVEAAYVFSIALLAIGSLLHQAFLMHDRTAANMILQEAVETGRRLEEGPLEKAVEQGMENTWILYRMGSYGFQMEDQTGRVRGIGRADGFFNDITMPRFDPEMILRAAEGILGAGEERNGDQLQKRDEP